MEGFGGFFEQPETGKFPSFSVAELYGLWAATAVD
jgi:hypothetical protein